MFRSFLSLIATTLTFSAVGAEKIFDFTQFSAGQSPTGFVSTVSGVGKPGEWKILEDVVPFALAPLSTNASVQNKRRVLAQVSEDATDEHFPLLIYKPEVFGDFTLTTRFKCVSGKTEQMAGIAFRIQDEKNYYVVRASSLGNSFRFFEIKNGERTAMFGKEIPIPSGTWHEMKVECRGTEIFCFLNGTQVIPTIHSSTFPTGKIGFWTKSDSVSYFTDTKMTYTPREPLAQAVVRDMMKRYPRLIGLKIYAMKENQLQVVASSDEKNLGEQGTEVEADVVRNEKVYVAKGTQTIAAILPLRDRNGDTVAALRVTMKSFPGQTENNAIARATPINQEISARIQSAKDMVE